MRISLDFPAVLYVAILFGGFVSVWAPSSLHAVGTEGVRRAEHPNAGATP